LPNNHSSYLHTLLTTTALAAVSFCAPAWAQGLPTGGHVASGAVSFATPHANVLNVTQSTPSAIVNWK